MMSKLNIVVRDAVHPFKPYSSTAHNFYVGVFNCDNTLFTAKPLTGIGPGGGRIYGEIEVPQGAYLVVGIATCKNVLTNWVLVVAGCGEHVCVNLLPRKFDQCANEIRTAVFAAMQAGLAGQGDSFSSPPQQVDKEMVSHLRAVNEALRVLLKHFPHYEPPIPLAELEKLRADEELIQLFKVMGKEE